MARRSIGFPLALGIVSCLLAVALAVGWQVLLVGDLRPLADGMTTLHWVFVILGALFSILILVGLVWLCAWLVREMRVNQSRQAFLDAVTHEMKTPLASLRLYLETLERHDPSPERRREFLHRMSADVERLEHTVGQVLTAARAEARRGGGEPLDLVSLLRSCAEEAILRHELPAEAVDLDLPNRLVAWGHPAELRVVFRNLIENAIQYSEAPAQVRVRATGTMDGRVHVEIRDRGIGLEPAELRKVFQRFYRAGRDATRQATGLGLGLYIVWNLVRRQGGRIVARSDGPGQGSRFVVTLRTEPRGSERRSAAGSPSTQEAPAS